MSMSSGDNPSVRGHTRLLAAIFGVSSDKMMMRFGFLPPGKKQCLSCGELIPKENKMDICTNCNMAQLECYECGRMFKINRSVYKARTKHRKLPFFFCSRRCYGSYFGRVHGVHVGDNRSRYRKYDYAKVQDLWLSSKQTIVEVSRTLNIPYQTVNSILRQYPPYVNYRSQLSTSYKRRPT